LKEANLPNAKKLLQSFGISMNTQETDDKEAVKDSVLTSSVLSGVPMDVVREHTGFDDSGNPVRFNYDAFANSLQSNTTLSSSHKQDLLDSLKQAKDRSLQTGRDVIAS
jgi:hypothetical protein